jgi:hypothetical protein
MLGVEPTDVGLYFYLEMMATCGNGPADVVTDTFGGAQHLKVKTGISSTAVSHSLFFNFVHG